MLQPDLDDTPADDAQFDLSRYLDDWYDKDDEFNQQGTEDNDN